VPHTASTLRLTLALVAGEALLGRHVVAVTCVRRQDDTPVLVAEGWSGRERRGQGSSALGPPWVGWRPWAGRPGGPARRRARPVLVPRHVAGTSGATRERAGRASASQATGVPPHVFTAVTALARG
jgi:hypothetical protein